MHSESTWFTSVRSLAETDSPGRAQTGTRLAASPGVSDTACVGLVEGQRTEGQMHARLDENRKELDLASQTKHMSVSR